MSLWIPGFLKISPIFEPLLTVGYDLERLKDWPNHATLEKLKDQFGRQILTCSGKPVHFVPQHTAIRTFEQQYEPRIYLTGEIQTRSENWHDLFNALVWLTFPRVKAILNRLHHQELLREKQLYEKHRGVLRDAVTLLDESGVVVVTSDPHLVELLNEFEWKELFWQQRIRLQESMRFFVFGHGLYEKVLNPYVGMTGKGVVLVVKDEFFRQTLTQQLAKVDAMLADFVEGRLKFSSDLTPIPILGYPGWSSDSSEASFYDNKNYFRPHPIKLNKKTIGVSIEN